MKKTKKTITQSTLQSRLDKGALFIDVIEGDYVNRYFNCLGLDYTSVRECTAKDRKTLPELID
jgi:hypothetical protein